MRKLAYFFLALFVLPLLGEELCPAGGFEGENMKPLWLRRNLPKGADKAAFQDGFRWALQGDRFHSGEKSLCLEEKKAGCSLELNTGNIACRPGLPHVFSFRYYIEEAAPDFKVSARIIVSEPGKKPTYLFPVGTTERGKWQTLRVEFYPGPTSRNISLTVWFGPTPCKVYVDDFSLTCQKPESVSLVDVNTAVLKQMPGLTIWKQGSCRRIDATQRPSGMKPQAAVELTSAANEGEMFQLALFPEKEIRRVTLSVSDLKSKEGHLIPAAQHRLGIIRYIPMKNPNNPALKGEVADPLLPLAETDAPAGKNTIFYVRLFAPEGTAPGLYEGKLTVRSEEKPLAEIPLRLKVRNFTLPASPSIQTFFYGNPGMLKSQYHDVRPWEQVSDNLASIYQDFRITGNPVTLLPRPVCEVKEDEVVITDWSKFDAMVQKLYREYGQRAFTVPVLRVLGFAQGWTGKNPSFMGVPLFTERARRLAGSYARQFHEHWTSTFPSDAQYFCYIYDEPPLAVLPELNRFTDAIRQAAPEFRLFLTHKVEDTLRNISVFCVPMAFGFVDLKKQEGKEIWYYNWHQPLAHQQYLQNRSYPWRVYANGGQGALKWQTSSVPGPDVNPWDDLSRTYGNGEATTIYPALTSGGPLVPSLRLAHLREGIDDGDYLTLLERKVESRFPGQGRGYLLSRIREIIPERPFGCTEDPETLSRIRDDIGQEIETFDLAPVCLVQSRPMHHAVTEVSTVEIQVLGPDGALVKAGAKTLGSIKNGKLTGEIVLERLGDNRVPVTIALGGRQKRRELQFTLKKDANLLALENLVSEMKKLGLDAEAESRFAQAAAGKPYLEADRRACAELVEAAQEKLLRQRMAQVPLDASPLLKACHEQALSMQKMKLYKRAAYYLKLADAFARHPMPKESPLSIRPVTVKGCFGFEMSNGRIAATILEMGGRIISFKVNGTETLAPGNLEKAFPASVRAAQAFETYAAHDVPFLGGYEDASISVLPESAVDWDISVVEASAKRIALGASMVLRGGRFRISRIMSIVPDSSDLAVRYTITNLTPEELRSDDPVADQFNWRARIIPAIGDNKEQDTLDIPTSHPMPARTVETRNPLHYEIRNMKLDKPYLRVRNAAKRVGLLWKLPPDFNYAYIWFDSRKNPVYTLEVFRSSFFSKPGLKENTPFTIEPGHSVDFTVTLTGETL